MTRVGSGGAVISRIDFTKRFKRQYEKIPPEIKKLVPSKLNDLIKDLRPPGLRFEKLKGYRNPEIYTIHITGKYKISFEVDGNIALLRTIGNHNAIDRQP